MTSRLRASTLVVGLLATATGSAAQHMIPGATHQVFLADGQALPSYGESALVADRLVFTLLVNGTAGRSELQLMSLPIASVDLDRTRRYTDSMRAAHYAATRGEADYAAVTAEVERALGQLRAVAEPKRRLELAQEARRRLVTWSEEHYSYRAADIAELAGLFDEVIAQLRAAAGQSHFEIDLRSGPVSPGFEPLRAAPGLRDSIALALSAAGAADIAEERMAVLRVSLALLEREPAAGRLREEVRRRLDQETAAESAYATLFAHLLATADAAMRRGDVAAVIAARTLLGDRDRALGGVRPHQVRSLAAELDARLEVTRKYQLALDHYAQVKHSFFNYERRVRPALSGLDGVRSILGYIREMRSVAYERLERAGDRLRQLAADLARVTPPRDLTGVHATLVSAVHLAGQACARRRLAVTTLNMDIAREASTAAAGAELLLAQVREQLVRQLYPPTLVGSDLVLPHR